MTDEELSKLLSGGESDRVEFKESMSSPDRIRQAICAFANDMPNHNEPGVLFVGVKDDGSCAHLPITDELLLKLGGVPSEGRILPRPSITVQKRVLKGCELAAVVVEPSRAPPVLFDGRVWIRVEPRRATATAEEEGRLNEKRRARDLPFDLRSAGSASLDDLDKIMFERDYLPSAVARDVIEDNERTEEQRLASLRFVSGSPPHCPTIMGVLVLGKTPADFVPGAYVQFLRIDGNELTDPIANQHELHGPMSELIQRMEDLLRANIRITSDLRSHTKERRQPDYPLVALQQLSRNAIMHRNYETSNAPVRITWLSDRVEIQNPGGPFGQVTTQNFGTPGITDYRNPHLAEALKNLGFVQRFGVGIVTAKQELERNGNPAPDFLVEENHVLVIVRTR